jgi:hypothetical protein
VAVKSTDSVGGDSSNLNDCEPSFNLTSLITKVGKAGKRKKTDTANTVTSSKKNRQLKNDDDLVRMGVVVAAKICCGKDIAYDGGDAAGADVVDEAAGVTVMVKPLGC